MNRPSLTPVMLRFSAAVAAGMAAALLCGCETEERIVGQRSILDGLEGAVRADGEAANNTPVPKGSSLETVSDDRLIIVSPTGDVALVSQSPRHVLLHVRRLLTGGLKGVGKAGGKEEEVFFNQLLAATTKKRLLSEGQDPQVGVEYIYNNRDDVLAFVNAMPTGELSTEVVMQQVGDSTWRLGFRGGLRQKALRYQNLWMCKEGGVFKFMWIN